MDIVLFRILSFWARPTAPAFPKSASSDVRWWRAVCARWRRPSPSAATARCCKQQQFQLLIKHSDVRGDTLHHRQKTELESFRGLAVFQSNVCWCPLWCRVWQNQTDHGPWQAFGFISSNQSGSQSWGRGSKDEDRPVSISSFHASVIDCSSSQAAEIVLCKVLWFTFLMKPNPCFESTPEERCVKLETEWKPNKWNFWA